MTECVVIGAGGHARAVIALLLGQEVYRVKGIIDLQYIPGNTETILNIPIIGGADHLDELWRNGVCTAFLAIGGNALRKEWYLALRDRHFQMPNLVSPSAIIMSGAKLGAANVICPFVFIGPEVVLGDDNIINTGAIVEHEVKVGSHSHLAPRSVVAGRAVIGSQVFLGAGSTIIDKLSIVDNVMIGAGGVVIRNVDVPGVYVGVPCILQSAK